MPILDFWGPYAERGVGGGLKEWMQRICLCFTLSRIALTDSALLLSVCLQLVFFSLARDCMTFTLHDLTDLYVERVKAHRIKINDHSFSHNLWPNSKTQLKLKHLWEQWGPLVFRGPYAACVFCI